MTPTRIVHPRRVIAKSPAPAEHVRARASRRILVVHGCRLEREALAKALSNRPGMSVASAADCATGAQILRTARTDVVLLDVDHPIGNAFSGIRMMHQADPECRMIILASREYDLDIREAINDNVAGYLVGCENLAVLAETIDAVIQGRRMFSESIQRRLGRRGGRPVFSGVRSTRAASLSRRELDVLFHLSRGASVKEAAIRLRVSLKTADNHKCRLMKRLGIHDRVHLAALAIREGLVSPKT